MKLLHIDASPRTVRSVTRKLSAGFINALRLAHPNLKVTHHDVGHHPPPFISDAWVGAAFSPADQHDPAMKGVLHHSDALTAELLACDRLLIASPMHNFTVSASLKAWIDQVVRADMTFKVTEDGVIPLLQGKKALVITARGGFVAGTDYDFQEPYLRKILGFIGITDVTFIHAEGVNNGEDARVEAMTKASGELITLAKTW
ncbi:MAG: FMN-dependent NADH-azoreductase [Verrucomicrobia bacterium]|nr:FMN-dependent NADH-azoreductase [Verrucomicrobiota bacterium]